MLFVLHFRYLSYFFKNIFEQLFEFYRFFHSTNAGLFCDANVTGLQECLTNFVNCAYNGTVCYFSFLLPPPLLSLSFSSLSSFFMLLLSPLLFNPLCIPLPPLPPSFLYRSIRRVHVSELTGIHLAVTQRIIAVTPFFNPFNLPCSPSSTPHFPLIFPSFSPHFPIDRSNMCMLRNLWVLHLYTWLLHGGFFL
jgi:hypothetical protein